MTAPTIEECLELLRLKDEALQFYYWKPNGEADTNGPAAKALALTPESVRESIQVREELVARLADALKACAPSWLPSAVRDMRREALALTPDSVAETVRARQELIMKDEVG